jgi:hypothetical protein
MWTRKWEHKIGMRKNIINNSFFALVQIWLKYAYILYIIDHIIGTQQNMSGKTIFPIHDHKQCWSVYDHGSLPLEYLLMPKRRYNKKSSHVSICFDHHHLRLKFINKDQILTKHWVFITQHYSTNASLIWENNPYVPTVTE